MASNFSTRIRVLGASLRAFLVLTVILGILYPLSMTGVAQAFFKDKADGSMVSVNGRDVGSGLIGQSFDLVDAHGNARKFDADGREVIATADGEGYTYLQGGGALTAEQAEGVGTLPDPKWFQPRPSASNYDGLASGASNYGPENPVFVKLIADRKAQVAKFNGVGEDKVPVDAVTASGSGLDPHISKAYALLQVERVAKERGGLDEAEVRALVDKHVDGPNAGFLGQDRVNVLNLNIALAKLAG
ncbi:potassium-transporting ATPase subunit C [Embleya sp. NBC_00888]|uniref:potassium-transporting ATPase subunit C n=1 Tax=Embleya sp. NBC_00888 TaxID=2975960 RepID=UPI00386859ED|nr:potassium-transporting ATPase subunit C [Embleya sp. NBC_00888]